MFRFKGISSNDMSVITEEEEHFIARAQQRYEITEIDGKDGAIFQELGYSYVERPISLQCMDINKIDNILSWLNGEGDFEYKGRITKARFYNPIEPERKSYIRVINTKLIRNPFWYKINDNFIQADNEIINEGNIESRPIIRLEKDNADSVDISIANIRFKYIFNNEEYVEIDCENKTVTYEGLIRNRQIEIGYEFPKLSIGSNSIVFNSGVCDIKFKRKDRWL